MPLTLTPTEANGQIMIEKGSLVAKLDEPKIEDLGIRLTSTDITITIRDMNGQFVLLYKLKIHVTNCYYDIYRQGRIQDLIRGAQIVTGLNCRWCTVVSCEQSEPFLARVQGLP